MIGERVTILDKDFKGKKGVIWNICHESNLFKIFIEDFNLYLWLDPEDFKEEED